MGFRFRRSFKVAPGVRVNLGKKSASVSFGTRGLRHTINTKGRQTSSIGIPGTGLYYTTSSKINSNKPIKKNLTEKEILDLINEQKAYIDTLTNLHKDIDFDIDWKKIKNTPPPYNKEETGPNEVKAIQNLENYSPSFLDKLFKSRYNNKVKELKDNIEEAKKLDLEIYKKWEELQKFSNYIENHDLKGFLDILESLNLDEIFQGFIKSIEVGFKDKNTMIVEYEPVLEDIFPERYFRITEAGNLSRKKYNKTDYHRLYRDYISGFAFRMGRNFLSLFPINKVLINVVVTGIDTSTGHMGEEVLLSVLFDDYIMSKLNFQSLNPFDALENFEHNKRFLKTKGFQNINRIYEIKK